MFTENNKNGVVFLSSGTIPQTHAFTTRLGGVSEGAFYSLNLGEHSGDGRERIRENYRRVCSALSISPQRLVFSRQVHGAEVRAVTSGDAHELFSPIPYEADALVTNEKGVALVIFTADCVPVLLSEPESSVIAAAHCGWRGSVADILGNVIGKMTELGASPENIRAAIGPAAGACCYETDADVPEAILGWLGAGGERFFRKIPEREGKYLCDLKAANRERLMRLGLRGQNIGLSDGCTMCGSEKYWSHRVTKGVRGSMASIIAL